MKKAKNVLQLSEARRCLSQLVNRVAQGKESIVITQHDKERAALVGIRWYRAAHERMSKKPHVISLRGIATLEHHLDIGEALAEHDARIRRRIQARAKETLK